MTKSSGQRLYRACVRCRQRKSRCDLASVGEVGRPPCRRCHIEGHDCVLAESRRGGDYSQHRKRKRAATLDEAQSELIAESAQIINSDHDTEDSQSRPNEASDHDAEYGSIQNPLEALQMLSRAAENRRLSENEKQTSNDDRQHERILDSTPARSGRISTQADAFENGTDSNTLFSYKPVLNGPLMPLMIPPLLQVFARYYHPYMPLAPRHVLSTDDIDNTCLHEQFLLTAILTIASKDDVALEGIHKALWSHMQSLILAVAIGDVSSHHVSTVEGLLLLAEWVPHYGIAQTSTTSGRSSTKSYFEDSAAWTLVGLAVRQSYLLRLDRYAFNQHDVKDKPSSDRNKKAWTFTYLSDRQISIRMGQAFWCRGPGLSTRLTAADYPSLQPQNSQDDDMASLLQAQVEITTLFGNIHDLLYPSKSHTLDLMRRGEYTKYLDDSVTALFSWKNTWTSIKVAPHLKCTLDLLFEYLRLYIHAFAFQAVVCRRGRSSKRETLFPGGVIASPDGRHVYLAIDAAKNLVALLNEDVDPVKHMRYFPVRFYLYEVHAVVFLFKAYISNAIISEDEWNGILSSIQALLSRLDQAASSEDHIAARYSKLIDRLFNKRSSLNKIFNAPIGQEAPQDKTSEGVHAGEVVTSDSQMPQLNTNELTGINDRVHDPMLTSVGMVTNDSLDPLVDLGFSGQLEMGLDNDFLNDYGTFNLDFLPFGSF